MTLPQKLIIEKLMDVHNFFLNLAQFGKSKNGRVIRGIRDAR